MIEWFISLKYPKGNCIFQLLKVINIDNQTTNKFTENHSLAPRNHSVILIEYKWICKTTSKMY